MNESTVYVLYLLFALGGAAVYFLMPRPERNWALVGSVFGVAAVIGFLVLLTTRVVAPHESRWYFCLFSAIALLGASRVITHPKPVYSAIYFVMVVVATAALLVLQSAEFLAVALIIIYAGAILVTYLFVIMLAQQPGSPVYDRRAREPFAAVVAGFVLMGAIAGRAGDLPTPQSRATPAADVIAAGGNAGDAPTLLVTGNTVAVGEVLMTKYVVALEIAGILLLVSMVGAIGMSRKRVADDGWRAPVRPLGEVGKGAEPF